MKKRHSLLILLLSITIAIASVQLAAAEDLMYCRAPKIVSVNTVMTGTLANEDDCDCYAFYSGGGAYEIRLYTKTPFIDEYGIDMQMSLDYGKYDYYSVNKGYQMPEYHLDGGYSGFGYEGEPAADGWYVSTASIGKFKAGKKVGLGISGRGPGEYKFEIVGKSFAAPAKPVIKSVKGKNHAMTVKWKKAANAKGYVIQISEHKGYGNKYKEIKVSGSSVSKTLKNLKSGTYYVKLCSYKKVNGVTAYSDWTKAKKVKVK